MKILASASYQKSHYPESHCQHSISNGIGLQKFHFSFTNIFLKKQSIIYIGYTSIFFTLFKLFGINVTLIQLLISLQFPTHLFKDSKASIGVQDKWMFKLSEAPVHQRFGKNSHSEYCWQLSSKTSMLESFLSTLGSFSKSCSEQLFCREPV